MPHFNRALACQKVCRSTFDCSTGNYCFLYEQQGLDWYVDKIEEAKRLGISTYSLIYGQQ